MKDAKAYILKEKFASFKMEDESLLEMFHRLQVLVNDLKALGEKVDDKNFSHKIWFEHHDTKPSVGRYNDRWYI